jgi:hypothetical protein
MSKPRKVLSGGDGHCADHDEPHEFYPLAESRRQKATDDNDYITLYCRKCGETVEVVSLAGSF